MDKPSSSKLPGSIEEIQEESLNEETVEGQEEMSSTDRLHQKILEMQELLALIKKEGENKSSSYNSQNSPLEEQTTVPRSFRQHGSPSPYPRPVATSTPYTERRQNTLPRRVNIPFQMPTPSHKEIPRNTTPIIKIRAKDYNLWFDGKDVERFITKAQNIAETEGASGRYIVRQIAFWTKDEEISYHIEGMPGYKTADWDQLSVDMKRRWGTVSPERRYRLSSINDPFTKTQQEGGTRNVTQYRKFIGEYEAIITYLKRYQYIQGDINHNQEILASLLTSAQEPIYKETIKDRAMVQALYGGYIIPRLDILKLYIEQDLEGKVLIQQKELYKPKPPQRKTTFADESYHKPRNEGKESVKQLLNQLKTLPEGANPPRRNCNNNQEKRFPQNNQPYRPRNPLPPFSSSYQPYIPAQMAPRPPLKCAYCKEKSHSETRCTHLAKDLDKRIFRTQRESYLVTNYQQVPMEGNESAKDIVRAFAKEQAALKKKFMEKPVVKQKQEEEVKPTEKRSEAKSTSIAHVEDWSNRKPPTISSATTPLNHTLD
ncbi:hypothetical protein O181_065459 [Austropuccinia psidii MF-1]|uniref:Retrotransposon gag domain-containing protein n=1 Tax=Austropuccinia psidii MF-1 TaxID=1389203 RepID=A0A9Q3I4K2_9BASI|nr:hypothetical protein [Austropuccinia psidii MF-1]